MVEWGCYSLPTTDIFGALDTATDNLEVAVVELRHIVCHLGGAEPHVLWQRFVGEHQSQKRVGVVDADYTDGCRQISSQSRFDANRATLDNVLAGTVVGLLDPHLGNCLGGGWGRGGLGERGGEVGRGGGVEGI